MLGDLCWEVCIEGLCRLILCLVVGVEFCGWVWLGSLISGCATADLTAGGARANAGQPHVCGDPF